MGGAYSGDDLYCRRADGNAGTTCQSNELSAMCTGKDTASHMAYDRLIQHAGLRVAWPPYVASVGASRLSSAWLCLGDSSAASGARYPDPILREVTAYPALHVLLSTYQLLFEIIA